MWEAQPGARLLRVALTLAAVALSAGCGSARPVADPVDHAHDVDHAHEHAEGIQVDVTDPFPDAGLGELSQESDLVVAGQVTTVTGGIAFATDPDGGYSQVTVTVEETLKGRAVGPTVDIVMLSHMDGQPALIAGRPTPRAGDRGIWMLRAIDPKFGRDGYVLISQSGQILAGPDGLTGGAPGSPPAEEIERLDDLAAALEYVRARTG